MVERVLHWLGNLKDHQISSTLLKFLYGTPKFSTIQVDSRKNHEHVYSNNLSLPFRNSELKYLRSLSHLSQVSDRLFNIPTA